jgi:hypothetical protein
MPKVVTQKEKDEILRMLDEGKKIIDITIALKVSHAYISKLKKECAQQDLKIVKIENNSSCLYYIGDRQNCGSDYKHTIIYEKKIAVSKIILLKKWLLENTTYIQGLCPVPSNTTPAEFETLLCENLSVVQ